MAAGDSSEMSDSEWLRLQQPIAAFEAAWSRGD